MSAERVASELTVAILPLGKISAWQITLTAAVLKQEFGVKTTILSAKEIPSQYFNVERGRYTGGQILNFLFFQLPANAQWVMGIMKGELENDGELCHGCADLYHKEALYSTQYLSEQQSQQPKHKVNRDLFSCHLIIHEFGHTIGITHCDHPKCAMNENVFKTTLCDNCRRWANRELRVQPGSAEERFSRAESLLIHGCFPQAIAVYREAISRAPKEPLYYNRLNIALRGAGQTSEANKMLLRAAIISNDYPNLYYNFGLVFLNNQLERAEDSFAKAIAAAEDPQFTQRLVGQAYREILHDVERASRHYKEYLRLGGDDQDVVEWLVSRSKLDQL